MKLKNWHMVILGVVLFVFAQLMWYLTEKGII
jgi:hypothetical protein